MKSYSRNTGNTVEDDADYYEREIEKYMQESLDSTERSRYLQIWEYLFEEKIETFFFKNIFQNLSNDSF